MDIEEQIEQMYIGGGVDKMDKKKGVRRRKMWVKDKGRKGA